MSIKKGAKKMNYYIQGNAAKADQIKAAFEKLGYDISWPGGCANSDVINIGVERNGAKYVVAETSEYIKDIIKTHPDYKELELPVEPKFKVGDWITNGAFTHCIVSIVDGFYYFYRGGYLDFGKIDGYYHLWTIEDAKDGDVLITENGNPFIFCGNKVYDRSHDIIAYGGLNTTGEFYESYREDCWTYNISLKPATKEQRDMLFKKMKEAGYTWDAYKKELKKIKPHYDIANFKPFDKVLGRDYDKGVWICDLYSYYYKGDNKMGVDNAFICVGDSHLQCIPYNDDTKHLLGTTNPCDKCYINW